MNLSVYLLAGERTNLDNIIPAGKLGPGGFQPLGQRGQLPFPARAFLKRTPGHSPDWRTWVASGFDLEDNALLISSYGCVILLLVEKRVFAACFGGGWSAVTRDLLESDFGLTVALSQVDASNLRHLQTKTLERRTRERSTYRHGGGGVADFAVDIDVEWLRSASGKTKRQDCSVIAGADALKMTGWKGSLKELHAACTEFLRLFERGIPNRFQFAENLRPIKAKTPLSESLDEEIRTRLRAGKFDDVSVVLDANVALGMSEARLRFRDAVVPVNDLDDHSLRDVLRDLRAAVGLKFDPTKVVVEVVDQDEQTLISERLEDLLQAEVRRGRKLYVRIERAWFQASQHYVRTVNAHIARVEDATKTLKMPAWAAGDDEGKYNVAAASGKGWLLQDQVFVQVNGASIEPCDLLTKERDFICVKSGKASSMLSHLFAQASVSAELLARERSYADEVGERYRKHFSVKFEDAGRRRFVLAIGRSPAQDLFGKMLLSKINALEHLRRIRSHGFDVAFCRIDLGSS